MKDEEVAEMIKIRFAKPMFPDLTKVERDRKGRYILNKDGSLKMTGAEDDDFDNPYHLTGKELKRTEEARKRL